LQVQEDKVYLARTSIASAEAPFETYRELAYRTLAALEIPLPAEGTVLLKPNATVLYAPDKRVITHPGFVGGLLDALLERGVAAERLVVGDGQSGEQEPAGYTWEKCGYGPMLGDRGVRLKEMNDDEDSRSIEVPGGVVYERYPIYREVTDCGFFFNVPLAKCHNLGCTTLSIKNLMGILAKPERHLCVVQEVDQPFAEGIWRLTESGLSHFEDRFYHKLCDIVAALRGLNMPRLCVVDGLIGRDGTAFNVGGNYPLGWALAGVNEVHVDAVATYLMGLDPEQTPYLKFARERDLGEIDVERIEVVDLASGAVLEGDALMALRREEPLMPVARLSQRNRKSGYYKRFRQDGSVVPWQLDRVNDQRREDGLDPISYELADD
jgi:uncharacterized protein (DUF362 family)